MHSASAQYQCDNYPAVFWQIDTLCHFSSKALITEMSRFTQQCIICATFGQELQKDWAFPGIKSSMGIRRKSHSFLKEAWNGIKQHQSFQSWRMGIPKSRLLKNSDILKANLLVVQIQSRPEWAYEYALLSNLPSKDGRPCSYFHSG